MRAVVCLAALALAACAAPPNPWQRAHFGLDAMRFAAPTVTLAITGHFPDEATAARAVAPTAADLDGAAGVHGRVLALDDGREAPLADAIVSTGDGRSVRTAADGRFVLAGEVPAGGEYVVVHAGYVASGMAGLAAGQEPIFRLQPRVTRRDDGPTAGAPFVVRGHVAGPDGAPRAGVAVTAGDARGAFAAPVLTDAAGAFTLAIYAPGRALRDGTLLAAGAAHVGVMRGVAADEAHAELAAPLALVAADRTVRLVAGAARATPVLVAVDGTALALPLDGGRCHLTALEGTRLRVTAEAADVEAGERRIVVADPVDPGTGPETPWQASLLAPPDPPRPRALALNAELAWHPVPGASRYVVRIAAPDGSELWQGTTPEARLVLSYQGALPAGRYGVQVEATDRVDSAASGVASPGRAASLTQEVAQPS